MQSRYMRTFTSKLSGLFLQNFRSALTNMGGASKNITRAGLERTANGIHMLFGTRDIEKV